MKRSWRFIWKAAFFSFKIGTAIILWKMWVNTLPLELEALFVNHQVASVALLAEDCIMYTNKPTQMSQPQNLHPFQLHLQNFSINFDIRDFIQSRLQSNDYRRKIPKFDVQSFLLQAVSSLALKWDHKFTAGKCKSELVAGCERTGVGWNKLRTAWWWTFFT